MIKAVLFDLDGTLLDSAPDMVAALNHLRAGLNLDAIPIEDLRHFVSRGAPGVINAGMPPGDDETRARWREAFLAYYEQHSYVYSEPFEGVEWVLDELRKRNIPWGIVTSKVEHLCFPILKKIGWDGAATIICGDTLAKKKPDPEPVLAACKQIGVRPKDTLMVGDDLRDMEAGRSAGCRTAYAMYGYVNGESQSDIIGDAALLHSPRDTIGLLDRMASKVSGA